MNRLVAALAVLGFGVAIAVVSIGQEPPRIPARALAPRVPFDAWVAGAGVLEASTQNIAIGASVGGIVSTVHVKWGDRVATGDPLFTIDERDARARLASALASVKVAEAALTKAEHQLEFVQDLDQSVSKRDLAAYRDDVAMSHAALDLARAQVDEIRTEIARRTVRAPVDGRVLQVNVRAGETAPATATTTPLVLLGEDRRLHVRVEVDQHDSWRVHPGAKAVAFLRGNPTLEIPLQFVRIEPYVLPKLTLTGRATERTDVRVLQVIYAFDRGNWPVYAGQEVDVFVDAPHVAEK